MVVIAHTWGIVDTLVTVHWATMAQIVNQVSQEEQTEYSHVVKHAVTTGV